MIKSFKRGVSLIELILALGILAMIMLPVFLTFSTGNRNVQVTEAEFRAHSSAMEIMEQILSLPFKQIPVGKIDSDKIKTGNPLKEGSGITFLVSDSPEQVPEIDISTIEKDGLVRFKKVSVKISFPESKASKKLRTVKIQTLVANETD